MNALDSKKICHPLIPHVVCVTTSPEHGKNFVGLVTFEKNT